MLILLIAKRDKEIGSTTPTHYILSVQLVDAQFCYQSDYSALWRPSIDY